MNTELCYLSAIEALELFQSRKLSPVELTRALIEQAECVESEINAFSHTYFEEAMDQAKASELRYLKVSPDLYKATVSLAACRLPRNKNFDQRLLSAS